MFVGMGAKRVRELFAEAKKSKPCIIFIDEIDSLFTKTRRKGEHSSSRATINQFLAENYPLIDSLFPNQHPHNRGANNSYDPFSPTVQRAIQRVFFGWII